MESGQVREPNSGQVSEQRSYLSYLLRLWRMSCDDEVESCVHSDSFHSTGRRGWRASLENPHTGERLGFGSLEDLYGFLCAQAGLGQPAAGDQGRESW